MFLGIVLMYGVLLRFGLLALVVTFYTFLCLEIFPLTTDVSRPYATTSMLLVVAVAAVSMYTYYASRGDAPRDPRLKASTTSAGSRLVHELVSLGPSARRKSQGYIACTNDGRRYTQCEVQ